MAFWATPAMTAAHLTFALGISAYILTAIYFEERDLARFLGQNYAAYQKDVPMLIPGRSSRQRVPALHQVTTGTQLTMPPDETVRSLHQTTGSVHGHSDMKDGRRVRR